jgi:hypothetical protein
MEIVERIRSLVGLHVLAKGASKDVFQKENKENIQIILENQRKKLRFSIVKSALEKHCQAMLHFKT